MTNRQKVRVCDVDAVPTNEMRCITVDNHRVMVANTDQGYFVADEMCTHEDARLCDGNLTGTLVKCPLHGSRFDLVTGRVLDDPAEDDLVVYPVTIENDGIWIEQEKAL